MKKFFTFLLVVVLVLLCLRIAGVWKSEPDDKNKNKALEPVEVDTTADSVAMEQSTHLKFKGVPIDGSLAQFLSRMQSKGFEVTSGRQDEIHRLEGDFAGFKQCEVYVSTLDNQDLVSRITVCFPTQDQWKKSVWRLQDFEGDADREVWPARVVCRAVYRLFGEYWRGDLPHAFG